MKITNIETYPVDGRWLFVVVDTDEGIYGVGESGLSFHELAVIGVIEHAKHWLIGQDADRIEHIWQTMSRGRFFPAGPVAAAALSAIDIALWDIQGKARGVPVYQLLGGRVRDKVACYTGLPMPAFDTFALVDNAQKSVAAGWKNIRWKLPDVDSILEPRRSVRAAVNQIEAVRLALGEEVGICFDVHTRLDLPDAVQLCREVETFHPFFMEDPLRAEDPHSYHALRPQVAVPLAVGEQYHNKWMFRELIENDLLDYVRMDVCIVGGISESRKIAGWAETHHMKIAPHNPLGPVSTAACLHLDLACSNFGIQEQHGIPGTTLTDVFPVQVAWADGYLLPPQRPGLGIEFDRTAAGRHPFKMPRWDFMIRREDGTFTNT